jgi:hypothetical protein
LGFSISEAANMLVRANRCRLLERLGSVMLVKGKPVLTCSVINTSLTNITLFPTADEQAIVNKREASARKQPPYTE